MEGLDINQILMNCVIKGTIQGFEMTGLKPDAVGVSRFYHSSKEFSVIVGLHGQSNGNVNINFSKHTASFIAAKFIGAEVKDLNEDVIDAICEIGNIVAGRFKELLRGTEFQFDTISLPAIIFGGNYNLYHLKNITTVSVMFEIKELPILHIQDKFFTTSISLLGQSGC